MLINAGFFDCNYLHLHVKKECNYISHKKFYNLTAI